MLELLFLLLLLPFSVTSLSIYFLYHYQSELDDLFSVYTFFSALLTSLLPLVWSAFYFCQKKTYGYFDCEWNCFHTSLLVLSLLWSCFSLGVFYSSASQFPPLSTYGGFTVFYLLLFSLLFFGAFILLLFICDDAESMYKIIVPVFVVPLVAIGLALFLGTQDIFKQYPFFSYNMLLAIVGTFLTLLVGAYVHSHLTIHSKKEFVTVILLQSLGGIGFPLLPASVLFNFILLLLQEDLFQGETYTFACLAISNTYLLAIAGLAGMAFHNYFDLIALFFSENVLILGPKYANLIPLFQTALQILVLLGYFLFSERDLSLLAIFGAISVLFFSLANLLFQTLLSYQALYNFQQQTNNYEWDLKLNFIARGVTVGLGAVVSSIFLGFAQKEDNIFYTCPQFSLFMLLSLFSFAHSAYAVLPLYRLLLSDLFLDYNAVIHQQPLAQPPRRVPFQQLGLPNIQSALQPITEEDILETLIEQQCAICLSGLFRGTFFEESGNNLEVSKLKKCGHCFHTQCISDWLSSHRNCPLDRRLA